MAQLVGCICEHSQAHHGWRRCNGTAYDPQRHIWRPCTCRAHRELTNNNTNERSTGQ